MTASRPFEHRGTPSPFPPSGYERSLLGDRDVVALSAVAAAVADALAGAPTLAAWAAASAAREIAGGRGPAWRVELGGVPAAVRHYRRGGWMGPLLGDRYLDATPRPFVELSVSESLRGAGVPTPRVLAAVVVPAHPGYRADIATEWLSPGLDLEEFLRPNLYPAAERAAAIEEAGRTIGRAHEEGLDHPDLRPRNVFLQPLEGGRWKAALLDLDRARIAARGARAPAKKKTSSGSTGLLRRSFARAA
ncbi:MAG TPA: lipopolysaccharide kinase InaA family protein [Gemmatimonadota bacterium]|nr:lipopolysaccharide kinase InaA family protein [Gemmatimonadota bacterium]